MKIQHFRCRFCHQGSHPKESWPQARGHSKRKKGLYFKSQSWKPYDPPLSNEEENETTKDLCPYELDKVKNKVTWVNIYIYIQQTFEINE